MPAQALALVGSGFYKWNGLWKWTGDSHPGMWDPQKLALAPRVGVAIRINDRTALRVRLRPILTPSEYEPDQAPVSGFETVSFLEPPYFGVKGYQNTRGSAAGRSAADHLESVPAANPLMPISGKAAGHERGPGRRSSALVSDRTSRRRDNDRFNVNFQRQLPGQIVASFTWFLNIGNQHYTKAAEQHRSAHSGGAAERAQHQRWTIRSTTT